MSDLVSYLYWARGRHLGWWRLMLDPDQTLITSQPHHMTTEPGRSEPAGFQDDRRGYSRKYYERRMTEEDLWENITREEGDSEPLVICHAPVDGGLWWLISDQRLSQQHGRTLTLTTQWWHNCHSSHILENFTETRHSLYSIGWWS